MIPLQMTNGGPGKFLQEEVWQVSATKARRTPEETQMEMKLFAFPSVCLTDPPPPVSMGFITKVSDPIRNLMAATHT